MNDADANKPDEGDTPGEHDDAAAAGLSAGGEAETRAAGTADAAEQPAVASPLPARGGLFSALIPNLALIVSVIAVAIAGYVLWQYREFYVALDRSDAELGASIEDTRANQRRLADDVDGLRGELTTRDLDIARLEGDIESVPAQIRALERRFESMQGGDGRLDVRESWLRAQAEYYLEVANTELRLGGRWSSAIEALELADSVLRALGDPALSDVRAAIAAELQSLRAVDWPDLARLASDLNGLIDRLPELPMRADSPREYVVDPAASGAPEAAEPGLGRLWQSFKGAVTSVIRVERREEPVEQVLTESERELVRRQLALELQIARAAAVQEREGDFRASLEAAGQTLSRDFNRDDAGVAEARRMLAQMAEIDLVPPRPDISDSLMLLKAAPGAD